MNSGIYEYTFANGDNYIGQAVDIKKRWDQHISKMEKGQHTKLVQEAYNMYGLPKFHIFLKCHPNYLDAMEAWLINRYKPQLNGNIPVCYDNTPDTFTVTSEMLEKPLFGLLYDMHNLRSSREDSEELIAELKQEIGRLEKRVLLVATEKLPRELQDYIHTLETDADFLSAQLKIAESAKDRLSFEVRELKECIYWHNSLPWYKRIFHTV